MRVSELETPTNTETPTADPVFRAMSALAKQGLGWEDLYVRLNAGGFVVTKAECRRFIFPLKARRPLRGGSGRFAACDGAATDAEHH